MTDYFSPTVIQPAIPIADMTPLERVLLTHIFNAELDGRTVYFYDDEKPADMIWFDRAPLEATLAQSKSAADSTAVTFVKRSWRKSPLTRSRLNSTSAPCPGKPSSRTSCAARRPLRYITAVTAFTCTEMRSDGFGGMAVLITASEVISKSTDEILQDFLN